MEQDTNHNKVPRWYCYDGCNTGRGVSLWGVFLLVLGGYFLLKELGYINTDVSVWPVFLFAFGAYLVIRSLRRK